MSRLLTLAVYIAAYLLGRRHGYDDARVTVMRGMFPTIRRRTALDAYRAMRRPR